MAHSQLSLCPRRNATSVCRLATLAKERGRLSQYECHGADVCFSHPAPYGAHHCSSCFQRLGMSCSGTEVLDTRRLVSYLSETSRLRVSGLVSSFSRGSPRCSKVMVLSWERGEAPDEGLLSASSTRRHFGAHHLAFWADKGCWVPDKSLG